MNGKVDWAVFAHKFRDNPQVAFETLAYHIFCRKFNITEGIQAFYNQKHIEADPIEYGEKKIGFQAKYYETPSINARHKAEMIKAINGAVITYPGINELYFYVSRPFSQSTIEGKSLTETQLEIEMVAKDLGVDIHWVFPSQLEIILSTPDIRDLWTYFFESEKKELFDAIIRPKSLESVIIGQHEKLLTHIMEDDRYDWKTKTLILSGYSHFVKKNENCVDIVEKALDYIEPGKDPRHVNEDWLLYFYELAGLVSDESVQQIWAKVLGGEVNAPGTFSKLFLHTLGVMSSENARLLCNLAMFCFGDAADSDLYGRDGRYDVTDHAEKTQLPIVHPLIYIRSHQRTYGKRAITPEGLMELESLGLIHCNFEKEFQFDKKKVLTYGNRVIEIYGDKDNGDAILAGNVIFTKEGMMYYKIIGDEYKMYQSEILEFIVLKLWRRNCDVYINGRHILR